MHEVQAAKIRTLIKIMSPVAVYRLLPLFAAALAALAAVILFAGISLAEVYRWTDAQGRTHVTDNLFNVPQEYLGQIITYQESRGPSEDGDVPLQKSEIGYVLTAVINGTHEIRLLLDTGATSTVISPQALKKAGVALPSEKRVVVRTAGGEVRAHKAEIASLKVGWARKGPMQVVAHDAVQGCDGLLGMDFLGSYHFEILTYGPKLRLSP